MTESPLEDGLTRSPIEPRPGFVRRLLRWLRRADSLTLRFEVLRRIGRLVLPAYRFKWPQLDWWHDQSFDAYLDRFDERNTPNTDRRFMLYQLLRLVEGVPGDSAECGVFRGASSWLMAAFHELRGRADSWHFVFDSFSGLSQPSTQDGTHWRAGDLACSAEEVARQLSGFPRVTLLSGWIPERFHEIADRRFAFVHVDVDLHDPTRDSIAFFYPRLNEGGILVCDDYGQSTCRGATRAIDVFLADKPEKMIALPDGGGLFIKGCRTAPPFLAPPSSR